MRVVNLPSVPFMGVEFEQNAGRQAYPILLHKLQQFSPDILLLKKPYLLRRGKKKFGQLLHYLHPWRYI
ncbi:hypothetical protein NIES1031_11055 [Chroogloeocystis siderophila 5.2 s.c.1]|uniref:Uncharacterized protein n=1 Tax=Chroogloeocystis siderophila 5.2 s.c.1 TaxID=247279 RepID=A0A1U7HRZ2_9CHRO|nr:hypothetical protein NIES1031_11055 [Chroogloeocystis siderophila 5.2 s.c.1]